MQTTKARVKRVLAFMSLLVLSLTVFTTVFATEVTSYTIKTEIKVDNQPLTADTKITTGQTMEATNEISFPDSQQINAGDTLVLDLPKELGLVTKLEFPIVHENGEVIANAVTDPSTQKVTITFTNYFSENYKDKVMTLRYNVRPNAANLPKTGTYYFTFGSTDFTLKYNKDDGEAGDYEMKYGYQDPENPKRIKWRIVLNAVQDKLNNMVIKDDFSDSGQVLVESSFRAVRYATQPEKIPNEAALLKLEPIDNFTKKAEFTRITGFTINFGDNWNWAMYIEYTTELKSELPKGSKVANVLEWSASNFDKSRSINALTRLETASGSGSGDRTTTTTTTTTTSTTTTTTTTVAPTTTTTTTTEEPSTTSTTTTEEPSTTSTTTTEEPSTTSTTTTEEPSTTSTTTTEEPSTTSTTTTEEPSTTSTTTTEGPTTTSTTTTATTTTTTTTTTTGGGRPTTTTTTTTPGGPTTGETTESTPGGGTGGGRKKLLPSTGEVVATGLVISGVVVLIGAIVLKRKISNK